MTARVLRDGASSACRREFCVSANLACQLSAAKYGHWAIDWSYITSLAKDSLDGYALYQSKSRLWPTFFATSETSPA